MKRYALNAKERKRLTRVVQKFEAKKKFRRGFYSETTIFPSSYSQYNPKGAWRNNYGG